MNLAVVKKNWSVIAVVVLLMALTGTVVWAVQEQNRANDMGQRRNGRGYMQTQNGPNGAAGDTAAHLEEHGITPLKAAEASNKSTTADELAYLIEEEKLAHDVYQAMADKWGARVFGNIKNSETMHQNMVWAVMESRGLADPRQAEAGKFANSDLQALYDKLIAQGNQSVQEAYKVGVLVEETDIADLKKTIANLDAKDSDVKVVLENLLHASENHLRAFSRQVSR